MQSTNTKLSPTNKPADKPMVAKTADKSAVKASPDIALLFARDGMKASHIVVPPGTELGEHALPDDAVIVVVRGTGIIYVQQEPRHVEAGNVIDLVPNEEHSIEALEELELVIVESALAAHAPPPDDFF
ncbi:MAG: AraC family ligand binding domain-containing protein [Deltaproteobacteria bacterium]|nr:AraC family ligand binding domain-containing protein [Deltaproteobacteria bacterium]